MADSAGLPPADIFDSIKGCPGEGERHEVPGTRAGDIPPLAPPLLQDAVSTAVQDLAVQDLMDMTMSGDAWLDFDWSNFFSDIPMFSTEDDLLASSEALITDARNPGADASELPLFNNAQPFSDLASGQLGGTEVAGSAWSLGVETPECQQAHQTPTTSGESSSTSSPGSLTDSTESHPPSEKPKSQGSKEILPYQTAIAPPAPWGSKTYNGQHLFSYTTKGQWLLDRCFDKDQIREYVSSCPRETIFWLQQAPTKCGGRLDLEDRVCRWAGCPVFNRRITAGWLRVAFDEAPAQTSDGTRDPLKVAGCMHLWCFEQVLEPLEFHLSGRLQPEARTFPREERSVVTLEKSTDAGIIRQAYLPWLEDRARELRAGGPSRRPRPHEESLSFAMNRYHLDNQTAARQKARLRRNAHKADAEKRTIDVHKGDLGLFSRACRKAKHIRKCHRLDGELMIGAKHLRELGLQSGQRHPEG
ncbi:hypothetical protein ESCO_000120 [Escovopsis weberi]|uniref:Uncharacterized protein n=1 Tax=Escovopsis weberi TaxID=150374 RepID=A0A0M9VTU9_ESCWE|nr:hypothetical protein ESCO_000120 [Escovopsis weberi]